MSDSINTPNPEDIVAFLKQHPDFFSEHADLIADMTIPHATGGAVSLVEKQVAVLRERNVELRNRLNKLLEVAKENDGLFEKTRQLVLRLVEKHSLNEIVAALFDSLRKDFNSEIITLILFDQNDATLELARGISLNDTMERIPALMKGKRAISGLLRLDELDFLFLDDAPRVGSAAVIPLTLDKPIGLLAIGATSREHFRSSMDTLFISHIGDVLARVLTPQLQSDELRRSAP